MLSASESVRILLPAVRSRLQLQQPFGVLTERGFFREATVRTVRSLLTIGWIGMVATTSGIAQQPSRKAAGGVPVSFYDLRTRTLAGKPADLSAYKGKVSL